MKKVLAILLVMGIVATSVGCGASGETESVPAAENSAEEENVVEPAEEAAETEIPAADGEVKVLTICDSQPASSVIGEAIGTDFKEALEKLSGGTMSVEFYPAAQLGNGTTCMQMVQLGTLDMYRCDASALYDYGIDSMAVLSLPYVFEDRATAIDIANSDLGKELLQDITDSGTGFVGVGYFVDTPRCFFTAKTPVETIDDLKGLKIRSVEANLYLDYKAALGMNPTPLAFSEVYTSLSTGVIDAAANTLDSFVSNNLYEVCDYFIMNNGMIPIYPITISQKTWDSLSEEQQGWVVDAWTEAGNAFAEKGDAKMEEQIAFCEEQGVTFCYPTDEDKWAEACEGIIEEYGAGYEDLVEQMKNWNK